jgi:vacuolar-type H+-ATPase subunit D/Vma8
LNEREKLKYDYRRWVNDYTELLDKAHVTMDEVQSKYSQLSISFAISELSKISEITTDGKTRLQIEDRIKHLQSLIG